MALDTAATIEIQEFLNLIELWIETSNHNTNGLGVDSKHLANKEELLATRDLLKSTLIKYNINKNSLVTSIPNSEIQLKWLKNKADYIKTQDNVVDVWFYFRASKSSEIELDFSAIQPVVKGIFPPFNEEKIGTLKVNKRDDENKRLIIYKGTIEYPNSFLGGTFNIGVDIDYQNETYTIEHSVTYGAMSEEGTAIFHFLESLSVEGDIRARFFELEKRIAKNDINGLKINDLESFKEEIERMIEELETTLHAPLQDFNHLEILETIFDDDHLLTKHFGRHLAIINDKSSPAGKNYNFLKNFRPLNAIEANYINKLKSSVENIDNAIETLKEKQEKAAVAYDTARDKIKNISPVAAELFEYLHQLHLLDKALETLKGKFPYLKDKNGTDAFRLVLKTKEELEEIAEKIDTITSEYLRICSAIISVHNKLYKGKKLIDKGLRQLSKKQNKATSSLKIMNKQKYLELHMHDFIFDEIDPFRVQANELYKKYWSDMKRIAEDISRIDTSDMSVVAYNPDISEAQTDFKTEMLDNDLIIKQESSLNYQKSTAPITNTGTVDGINPEDVKQGHVGDCYFLSGVEALAKFSPEQIFGGKDSIITGPFDKGDKLHYIVKLYVPDERSETGNKRIPIKVKPTFVRKKVVKKKAQSTGVDDKDIKDETYFAKAGTATEEIWVQLLEKALAQLEGSFAELDSGSEDLNLAKQEDAFQLLTGKKISSFDLPSELNTALATLFQVYNNGNNKLPKARFVTRKDFGNNEELAVSESGEKSIHLKKRGYLYANHEYSLGGIENIEQLGKESFELQNPHSSDYQGGEKIVVTRAELQQYFKKIIIG